MQGLGNVNSAPRFHVMTRQTLSLPASPTPPARVEPGEDTAGTLLRARSQFELTMQSFRAIRTEEGEVTREVRFSLHGSLEMLAENADEKTQFEQLDPIARLRELFSPERTAERIAKFAIAGYKGEDTEEGRRAFAEAIGEAIQSGIQEARDILRGFGPMPEETLEEIDETESLVAQKLEAFAKLGRPALDDAEKDDALAFRASLSFQLERTTTVTLYNATGFAGDPAVDDSFAAVA